MSVVGIFVVVIVVEDNVTLVIVVGTRPAEVNVADGSCNAICGSEFGCEIDVIDDSRGDSLLGPLRCAMADSLEVNNANGREWDVNIEKTNKPKTREKRRKCTLFHERKMPWIVRYLSAAYGLSGLVFSSVAVSPTKQGNPFCASALSQPNFA